MISSTSTTTVSCTVERTPLLDGITKSIHRLRGGDYVNGRIPSRFAGEVVTVIDCEEPHDYEVYREALLPNRITTFDPEAIGTFAHNICRQSLWAYVGAQTELRYLVIQPSAQSWHDPLEPDRVITCLLFDDGGQLVGRAA